MPIKKIMQALNNYRTGSIAKRKTYLKSFEEKMIYRTTKTENPKTTLKMVQNVLGKLKNA